MSSEQKSLELRLKSPKQHLEVAKAEARSQGVWKERGDIAGEREVRGNLLCCSLRLGLLAYQRKGVKKP